MSNEDDNEPVQTRSRKRKASLSVDISTLEEMNKIQKKYNESYNNILIDFFNNILNEIENDKSLVKKTNFINFLKQYKNINNSIDSLILKIENDINTIKDVKIYIENQIAYTKNTEPIPQKHDFGNMSIVNNCKVDDNKFKITNNFKAEIQEYDDEYEDSEDAYYEDEYDDEYEESSDDYYDNEDQDENSDINAMQEDDNTEELLAPNIDFPDQETPSLFDDQSDTVQEELQSKTHETEQPVSSGETAEASGSETIMKMDDVLADKSVVMADQDEFDDFDEYDDFDDFDFEDFDDGSFS